MDSVELVKLAASGNISEFSAGVSDAVLERLRTKIEDYHAEVAQSVSVIQSENE